MNDLSPPLPFPIDPNAPLTWPTVCLADIWQPRRQRSPLDLAARYNRRLFAAPAWPPIWQQIRRYSLYQYARRPGVITRYQTNGRRLPIVLQAVMLGLALPRLHCLDGMMQPHQLDADRPGGALPLLGNSGDWIVRNWPAVKRFWHQQDEGNLRGLGFLDLGHDRIVLNPLPQTAIVIDRHAMKLPEAPIMTEAHLVACAVRPFRAHYRLNLSLLEKLRLHATKDALAPKTAITGQTLNAKRPQFNKLVVLPLVPCA